MNKAFTKEDDGDTPQRLPDLPISQNPNHVTPRGMELLQDRQAQLEKDVSRLRGNRKFLNDLYPLAVAERDLRYIEARLASAHLVEPPKGNLAQVSFGTTVLVEDENGAQFKYRIVGEDEADPKSGLISAYSPLAQALLEAKVGDLVDWSKPTGDVELEILSVTT